MSPGDLPGWLLSHREELYSKLVKAKKSKVYNIPASFDIETTSFYDADNQKAAIMYEWTFGIYDAVFIGRSWDQFLQFYDNLVSGLETSDTKRLYVYVHNLSFEFGFLQYRLEWDNVFSLDSRKPCYARTVNGIEFRCSYILTGRALSTLHKELHTYSIKKLAGDLDYKKIRHEKTRLTKTEILYCLADVKTVMAYIMEQITGEGSITKIPLTKTGYVRRFVRSQTAMQKGFAGLRYRELLKSFTIETDEYMLLKRAFQGGYTHGSPFYSGRVLSNVTSYDFTSSYPAVMCAEPNFPMSKGERVNCDELTQDQLITNLTKYCCVFEIEIYGLESCFLYDDYISVSRCSILHGAVQDNGRLVSADYLITTITEIDFRIIRKTYKMQKYRIRKMYRYRKSYLPKSIILSILQLYADKTKLKGLKGSEIEYQLAKALLNSVYGMCVTDPVRPDYVFTDRWDVVAADVQAALWGDGEKKGYNESFGRFLFYPWGVYVCALARANLWSAIYQMKGDYVYSDTDSVKILHAENHAKYFESYNSTIINKLYRMCDFYRIPREAVEPETLEGVKKPLGVWDYDGHYKRFKTLGAKRYLVQYDDGRYSLTVSGLNKKIAMPYIEKRVKDPFTMFRDDMYIPAAYTGKNTHTYIDNIYDGEKLVTSGERVGFITDYQGTKCAYHELSGVHLEEAEYSLSITQEYLDYIRKVNT